MMNASDTNQLVSRDDPTVTFGHQARTMVIHHGEKILGEIPTTLRRFAMLMLVLSISIPIFMVALLVVLWHLG
jgi:hypothetical protein